MHLIQTEKPYKNKIDVSKITRHKLDVGELLYL